MKPVAGEPAFRDIRPRLIRDKIAFVLHSPELLHHFGPVLQHFSPAEVDLLIFAHDGDSRALEARLSELPFHQEHVGQLLPGLTGYRVLVSNHVHSLWRGNLPGPDGAIPAEGYLLRALGQYNVRYMYGLGSDSWNLADWNQVYDAFLCQGPVQAARLQHFRGHTYQIGYPRYDRFFSEPFDRAAWLAHFHCDPDKPVLVWLSTQQIFSGALHCHAEGISRLSRDYNVLVKPHPFSWQSEPDYVAVLRQYPYTAVIAEDLDNLILYQLADLVLADYGGTVFSALYTDCRLILLDLPGYPGRASDDPLTSDSEAWVRRFLVHLLPEDNHRIPALLADEALWREQALTRAWLRQQLFSHTNGGAAPAAARLLRQMPRLLQDVDPHPLLTRPA